MREEIKNKIKSSPSDQVDLGEMEIQDSEIDDIARVIAQTRPKIHEVFLNNNLISDEGAKMLANRFSALRELSSLDIQFNKIAQEGATAVYSLLSTNKNLKVSFHGNTLKDVAEIENIKNSVLQKSESKPEAKKQKWWRR